MHKLDDWEVHYLVMIALARDQDPTFARELIGSLRGNSKILAQLICDLPVSETPNDLDMAALAATAARFREMAEDRRKEHDERMARRGYRVQPA